MSKMKDSEVVSYLIAADSFLLSAKMWKNLKLPDFIVTGYRDGDTKTWTVAELLIETAQLIKEKVRDQ